ncbi:unnamed protein product, partial [Staurois parvus]
NSASGSDLLSLFSSRSKTAFDLKGRFFWTPWMFLSFQAERTVKMQTGDRTKHSGQNVGEYVKSF